MAQRYVWRFRWRGNRLVRPRKPVRVAAEVLATFTYEQGSSYGSTLLALDVATGAERWRSSIGYVACEPVVANDTIYVSSFEGNVYALNMDGRERWRSPGTGTNIWKPVVAGEYLFFGEIGGGGKHTWCLRAATGAVVWQALNGGHTTQIATSSTSVVQTTIIASRPTLTTALICYAIADGRERWRVTTIDRPMYNPVVSDDVVYVGTRNGVQLFDLHRGVLMAEFGLPATQTDATAHFIAPDAIYFITSSGVITRCRVPAVADVGRMLEQDWSIQLDGPIKLAPEPLAADRLAIISAAGDLVLLHAADGSHVQTLRLGASQQIGGAIGVDKDVIVAVDREYRRVKAEALATN